MKPDIEDAMIEKILTARIELAREGFGDELQAIIDILDFEQERAKRAPRRTEPHPPWQIDVPDE